MTAADVAHSRSSAVIDRRYSRTNPVYTAPVISTLKTLSIGAVITALCYFAPGVRAQDSPRVLDAADLADGMRLYQQKGNCQACHGWAGDGRKSDNQMPSGANLRETKLNRNGLITVIKCGRLNSQMPAFD